MAIAKVILNGDTLMDVTSNTVTSENLLSGATAVKNDGTTVTGNIAFKTATNLTTSELTVTVPSGYYSSQVSKAVSDANLVASNIKSGVNIFGVSGTYSGVQPTYTATIIQTGNYTSAYVSYNGSKYYSKGESFTFNPSDNLYIYLSRYNNNSPDTSIFINDVMISRTLTETNLEYNYILPSTNIEIQLYRYANNTYAKIFNQLIPTSGIYGIQRALLDRQPILASGSSTYNYTSEDISNWCNSFGRTSVGSARRFEGYLFSGSFYFNNLSSLNGYDFARVWNGTGTSDQASAYLYFPVLSIIPYGTFLLNGNIAKVEASSCTKISGNAFQSCKITEASFPECTIIDGNAFYSCYSLSIVSFPECTSIGTSAFYNCSNLTTASFPKCTSIGGYAFFGCYSLSIVSFPECTSIGMNAFYNCSNLTTASFPKCTTIYSYAFYNCSNLTTASFSECTSIGIYAFFNCSSLSITSFPECTSIGSYAFNYCYNLSIASFPECTTIYPYAFSGCSNLTTASFPKCTSIGGNTFVGCSSLTNIIFSKCEIIGSYAFQKCINLTTVSFPKCTMISSNAFSNCYNLISFYLIGISFVPTLGNNVFYSTPINGYSASAGQYGSIYVPSSLYNSFITANNWSTLSSRIVSV